MYTPEDINKYKNHLLSIHTSVPKVALMERSAMSVKPWHVLLRVDDDHPLYMERFVTALSTHLGALVREHTSRPLNRAALNFANAVPMSHIYEFICTTHGYTSTDINEISGTLVASWPGIVWVTKSEVDGWLNVQRIESFRQYPEPSVRRVSND